jgi:hypothetical protein
MLAADIPISSEWQKYTYRYVATSATGYTSFWLGYDGEDKYFTGISVKEISPAQGELVVEWMPMFDSEDATGTVQQGLISTRNNAAQSIMFTKVDDDLVFTYDTGAVATSAIAGSWSYGDLCRSKVVYNGVDGKYQRIFENLTTGYSNASAITYTFVSWGVEKFLSPGMFANVNTQYIKSIKLYKTPQSW